MGFPIFSSLAQHQIPMQNARIYRVWLPSVIYSQHSTTLSYFGYSAAFTISGPLAQLAERGADNAKVVSSTLTRTNQFLFLLIDNFFNAILAAQIKLSFSILTSWLVFTYIRATYSTFLTLRTQQWCPREDKTKLQDCEIIDYLDQKFSYFTIAGPLAQSAERGADNAKVVSSTLTRTKEKFFFYLNFFLRNHIL